MDSDKRIDNLHYTEPPALSLECDLFTISPTLDNSLTLPNSTKRTRSPTECLNAFNPVALLSHNAPAVCPVYSLPHDLVQHDASKTNCSNLASLIIEKICQHEAHISNQDICPFMDPSKYILVAVPITKAISSHAPQTSACRTLRNVINTRSYTIAPRRSDGVTDRENCTGLSILNSRNENYPSKKKMCNTTEWTESENVSTGKPKNVNYTQTLQSLMKSIVRPWPSIENKTRGFLRLNKNLISSRNDSNFERFFIRQGTISVANAGLRDSRLVSRNKSYIVNRGYRFSVDKLKIGGNSKMNTFNLTLNQLRHSNGVHQITDYSSSDFIPFSSSTYTLSSAELSAAAAASATVKKSHSDSDNKIDLSTYSIPISTSTSSSDNSHNTDHSIFTDDESLYGPLLRKRAKVNMSDSSDVFNPGNSVSYDLHTNRSKTKLNTARLTKEWLDFIPRSEEGNFFFLANTEHPSVRKTSNHAFLNQRKQRSKISVRSNAQCTGCSLMKNGSCCINSKKSEPGSDPYFVEFPAREKSLAAKSVPVRKMKTYFNNRLLLMKIHSKGHHSIADMEMHSERTVYRKSKYITKIPKTRASSPAVLLRPVVHEDLRDYVLM